MAGGAAGILGVALVCVSLNKIIRSSLDVTYLNQTPKIEWNKPIEDLWVEIACGLAPLNT